MKKSIAQDAYDLLKDIPAENWIEGNFSDGVSKGCIIGHYTRLKSGNPEDFSPENCSDWTDRLLRRATRDFLWNKHQLNADGSDVNNSPLNSCGYNQPEIKDRCMALLQDMIEAEQRPTAMV